MLVSFATCPGYFFFCPQTPRPPMQCYLGVPARVHKDRKWWIRHSLYVAGQLVVDAGAVRALKKVCGGAL